MRFESGITVTVTRRPAGDEVGDRGAPTTHAVSGCAFAQENTRTEHERRQSTVTSVKLMCPTDADIKAGDRILAEGVLYAVDGEPWAVKSPFGGWTPGLVVTLKGVK